MLRKIKTNIEKVVIFFILGLLLYAALVLLADLKKIIRISYSFQWHIVIILLALSGLNYLFRFIRWHYFLSRISIKIPVKNSLRIFLAGLSMTVTPGKMGEIIKAYLVKKETGNRFGQIVPLLITERLTDGIGMIILAMGGVYLFRQSFLFFLFSAGIVLVFFLFVFFKKFTLNTIKKFEDKTHHFKVLDFFITFFDHSEKLLKPAMLINGIVLSVLAWFLEGLSLFILINSFGSFWDLHSLFFALFIFAFSSIAGFLVLIPGGIGVAEGSITSLITFFYQLDVSKAIFITLVFRFTTLWFGVFLGLINLLLSFSKRRLSD